MTAGSVLSWIAIVRMSVTRAGAADHACQESGAYLLAALVPLRAAGRPQRKLVHPVRGVKVRYVVGGQVDESALELREEVSRCGPLVMSGHAPCSLDGAACGECRSGRRPGQGCARAGMRSDMPNRYEYKVIELREKLIGGKMSGDRLEKILNDHAAQGWQLKAITAAEVKGRIGPGGVEGILITFERQLS